MAISKEPFLAILSMDAYNRGYGAGIADGGAGDSDGLGESRFYAFAYTMGSGDDAPEGLRGKTVISYRGTDNPGLRGGAVSGGVGILRHLHPLHSPASFVT